MEDCTQMAWRTINRVGVGEGKYIVATSKYRMDHGDWKPLYAEREKSNHLVVWLQVPKTQKECQVSRLTVAEMRLCEVLV